MSLNNRTKLNITFTGGGNRVLSSVYVCTATYKRTKVNNKVGTTVACSRAGSLPASKIDGSMNMAINNKIKKRFTCACMISISGPRSSARSINVNTNISTSLVALTYEA